VGTGAAGMQFAFLKEFDSAGRGATGEI